MQKKSKVNKVYSGPRRGVLSTRSKIIEVAGQLFADKGYVASTGKEICELAEVNSASISYHFGGMDMLYHEVLLAAYESIIALDEFTTLLGTDSDPKQRLHALCDILAANFSQPSHQSWEWRVISREALSPSTQIDELREAQLIPKVLLLRDLVSELMQLPIDHQAVIQGCLHVIAPIVLLQVGDWKAISRALPGFHIDYSNKEAVSKRFYAFIHAGLLAIAKQSRQ